MMARPYASYCTEAEYARFGGTAVCPSVGEIQVETVRYAQDLHGAGTADTPAALTWDQEANRCSDGLHEKHFPPLCRSCSG